MQAFLMPHKPISRNTDLARWMVSIDGIEDATGLDFLHELPDDTEEIIEEAVWELWPDVVTPD